MKDEILQKQKLSKESEIIASLDNELPISEFAKSLNEKWVNGEITSEEELKLILGHKN